MFLLLYQAILIHTQYFKCKQKIDIGNQYHIPIVHKCKHSKNSLLFVYPLQAMLNRHIVDEDQMSCEPINEL